MRTVHYVMNDAREIIHTTRGEPIPDKHQVIDIGNAEYVVVAVYSTDAVLPIYVTVRPVKE